jgi:hypothetical protein
MTTARRARPWCALAPLPAVAALACAALAGCGSSTAASDASTTTANDVGTVCAHARHVDRLTVDRVDGLNREHFTFPARLTVTGTRQSQAVAQALCALPPMPPGPINCPSDLGVIYWLSFRSSARGLPAVSVRATGCEKVVGLGPPRGATASFWKVLATAAGLPHPGKTDFGGTIVP